jgi:hypothetical protein
VDRSGDDIIVDICVGWSNLGLGSEKGNGCDSQPVVVIATSSIKASVNVPDNPKNAATLVDIIASPLANHDCPLFRFCSRGGSALATTWHVSVHNGKPFPLRQSRIVCLGTKANHLKQYYTQILGA